MATKLTSKGQVTVPKPVRDRLGLEPGTAVEFELAEDGRVVLTKVAGGRRTPGSRFDALKGVAWRGMSTDDIMAMLRD